MYKFLAVCVFMASLSGFISCKKSELEVVPGNVAVPDSTIEEDVYTDYINRTYILVLGREPGLAEFDSAFTILQTGVLNMQSRTDFLQLVFSSPDYPWRQFNKNRVELLNNIDTADITNQLFVFNFFLGDSTYQNVWPVLQYETDRLEKLRSASYEYASGLISIRELQSRMIDNYFYDQINMGADNFVISSFQHFLDRNPTLDEQSNSVSMINGSNAVLFLQAGSSKEDFLSILFNSDDYFEGAVIRMYKDYLLRTPQSLEMTVAATEYHANLNFENVLKNLLAGDEFVGLK